MPQSNTPWDYETASCYSKSNAKSISQKHTQEFQNVLTNLEGYKKALNAGISLEQAKKDAPLYSQ